MYFTGIYRGEEIFGEVSPGVFYSDKNPLLTLYREKDAQLFQLQAFLSEVDSFQKEE